MTSVLYLKVNVADQDEKKFTPVFLAGISKLLVDSNA